MSERLELERTKHLRNKHSNQASGRMRDVCGAESSAWCVPEFAHIVEARERKAMVHAKHVGLVVGVRTQTCG